MRPLNTGWRPGAWAVLAGLASLSCESTRFGDDDAADPTLSGGATTVHNATSMAFQLPAPNLVDVARHFRGDTAFEAIFVAGPAAVNGGLGPLYNQTSCAGCHISDGRGRPPEPGAPLESMLFRLSVPGSDPHGGPLGAPGFGGQLQDKALFGSVPEARVSIQYGQQAVTLADGGQVLLQVPFYQLVDSYLPPPAGMLISPRVAPPVFGLGLLEAVPEEAVLELADPGDGDNDGISGKPNWVWDVEAGTHRLGRFGWKAGQPSLIQQNAAAYRNDMGVTNPLFPIELTVGQEQHDGLADDPELARGTLQDVTYYTQTLGVPARRSLDEAGVRRGAKVFEEAGCAACHRPELETGALPGVPEVEFQTIRPYTDLLLHDMGEGLADGRPDGEADGREWRTAPLWGLGLTSIVSGHTRLLHDGRARDALEAIFWHGGEAEAAREHVKALSAADRRALLEFLDSL